MTAQIRVALVVCMFGFYASLAFADRVKHTITTSDTTVELWALDSEGLKCQADSLKSSTEAGIRRMTASGNVHITYQEEGKLLLDIRSDKATIETPTEQK